MHSGAGKTSLSDSWFKVVQGVCAASSAVAKVCMYLAVSEPADETMFANRIIGVRVREYDDKSVDGEHFESGLVERNT